MDGYKQKWRKLKTNLLTEYLGNRESLEELKKGTQFYKQCKVIDKQLSLILTDMDDLEGLHEFKRVLATAEKMNKRKYSIILNQFKECTYLE